MSIYSVIVQVVSEKLHIANSDRVDEMATSFSRLYSLRVIYTFGIHLQLLWW